MPVDQRLAVQKAPTGGSPKASSPPLIIQGAVVWRPDDRHREKLEARHAGRLKDLDETPHALQDTLTQVIAALVASIEVTDRYMYGHSLREAAYAVALAQAMRLPEQQAQDIGRGALLHDIGKLFISRRILRKPDRLTEDEYETVKEHAALGAYVLSKVKELKEVAKIVRHHHERFDGSGYPDGLGGDQIPLGARVVAVTDAFEAMTETRPYRSILTLEEALTELENSAGGQFDPELVEAFVKLARQKAPQWPIAHDASQLLVPHPAEY